MQVLPTSGRGIGRMNILMNEREFFENFWAEL